MDTPLLYLDRVPLFSELSDTELSELADCLDERNYKKDTVVVYETEEGSTLFIIKKGNVKISRTSDKGKEVILAILTEGDFFGEMSLLDGLARSANVTTTCPTELYLLRREDFLALIEKNPSIAIGLMKELALRIRKSDTQIKSLSLYDASGRVASALIQLAEERGTIKEGTVKIKGMPSQKDLANIAGTSRETTSRVLKSFMDDGIIAKSNGNFLIHNYESFKQKYG
ncbi:MAG: Crp/Fnr family transcriptional regulator [bacterium]|nr:Crp/Fnr family transcriptional regulator [bacterium]